MFLVDSVHPCAQCGWKGVEPEDIDNVENGQQDTAFFHPGEMGLGDAKGNMFLPICQFPTNGKFFVCSKHIVKIAKYIFETQPLQGIKRPLWKEQPQ